MFDELEVLKTIKSQPVGKFIDFTSDFDLYQSLSLFIRNCDLLPQDSKLTKIIINDYLRTWLRTHFQISPKKNTFCDLELFCSKNIFHDLIILEHERYRYQVGYLQVRVRGLRLEDQRQDPIFLACSLLPDNSLKKLSLLVYNMFLNSRDRVNLGHDAKFEIDFILNSEYWTALETYKKLADNISQSVIDLIQNQVFQWATYRKTSFPSS